MGKTIRWVGLAALRIRGRLLCVPDGDDPNRLAFQSIEEAERVEHNFAMWKTREPRDLPTRARKRGQAL